MLAQVCSRLCVPGKLALASIQGSRACFQKLVTPNITDEKGFKPTLM